MIKSCTNLRSYEIPEQKQGLSRTLAHTTGKYRHKYEAPLPLFGTLLYIIISKWIAELTKSVEERDS